MKTNKPEWAGDIELTSDEIRFIGAYLEALDFTETGDDEQPEKGSALDGEYLRRSIIECLAFYNRISVFLPYEEGQTIEQAGHDFWLTRNGHGAGFWDGDWPTYGEMFTKAAESFKETNAEFD